MGQFPKSRAALSLLGYCYYHVEEYAQAAGIYERLVRNCPTIDEYRIYHAQSLLKAGSFPDATKAVSKIKSPQLTQRISMLKIHINYEQEEYEACSTLLDSCLQDDPDISIASAAVAFKEGDFDKALNMYLDALDTLGNQPDLIYNAALCHYKLEDYDNALKLVEDLIEHSKQDYPEFFHGSELSIHAPRNYENSSLLMESFIIETFNLKVAIEYTRNCIEEAKTTLGDMPQRKEHDVDPISLHNQALLHMDTDATSGFEKLNFLLSNPPFPAETFSTLLLQYCNYGYFDLAADILAENVQLTFTFLTQDLYEFLDALIMISTSPEESYQKFEVLSTKHIEKLRKITKDISEANATRNKLPIQTAIKALDDEIESYMPILMAQSKIYWEQAQYGMVEKLFRRSAEFCGDHDIWKLNVAHVFFMQQGNKFKDAISYYAPFVKKAGEKGMLNVPANVLANLCVSYIMTNQNEEAEEIMKQIEREEDLKRKSNSKQQIFHSCIVNLVIGTLYCEKKNFEFGISRICKSIEPYEKKLCADTWLYTKRCLLALAENISKHLFILNEGMRQEVFSFLKDIEQNGKGLPTLVSGQDNAQHSKVDIAQEARNLLDLFIKFIE